MLSIKNVSLPLKDKQALIIDDIFLAKHESLLVVGDNASGKTLLAQLLTSKNDDHQGELIIPQKVAALSFEIEEQTLAFDRDNDNSDLIEGGVDLGRSAYQVISENLNIANQEYELNFVAEQLSITPLLNTPFKCLSTGEIRKVLMAKALLQKPEILILDEPFAGLDIQSQKMLTSILSKLITKGQSIILFDFYHSGLPKNIHKTLMLQHGKQILFGSSKTVINSKEWQDLNQHKIAIPHHLPKQLTAVDELGDFPLIKLTNVDVDFLGKPVFHSLSWQFEQGQHWQIIGPNGCGKSTLLAMISGDNTKAYGKEIWLFGKKRGSGETVWQIKQNYGTVSAQLHRDYRVSTSVLETILSGFFDSIGLYDAVSEQQINVAKEWMVLLDLQGKEKQAFSALSYGEQRLVLIIRAIIKLPRILILDEPCQGLDNLNREKVLQLIDYIADNSNSHILFVSHDTRDKLHCLTNQLNFITDPSSVNKGYIVQSTTIQK